MAIAKLLIANRGEIAVRIARAARELGIPTVQAHSAADRDMLAVRLADEAIEIGPPHPSKSYLSIEAVIKAAAASGADAIHPGYGFLSENARFAQAVEEAGLIFVGPTPETIRRMGDKAEARSVAAAAGVPVVPGSAGALEADAAAADAERIGFPVMIKAAAGGGGRGIRVARDAAELATSLPQAAAEARAAFGDARLYIERFIAGARHLEVQVLGDGRDVVHLFERECSLQRRRQKVWEEAPAVSVPSGVRAALHESAVRLARSVGYRGAGTIEYLYDDERGEFFFIEMNTRIQVEHPVTEAITGLDLVGRMIRIAGGEPLGLRQEDITQRGHAIEVRINAEDPLRNFAPAPGTIQSLQLPGGPGVRFDGLVYPGYTVPPFYDSLLGKLIVSAEDRPAALSRLRRALGEIDLVGLPTTIGLHRALAADPEIGSYRVHTRWLEAWLETWSPTQNKG